MFSAFSYMEFAARIPISGFRGLVIFTISAGSAYTFAYVCLGELAAWVSDLIEIENTAIKI